MREENQVNPTIQTLYNNKHDIIILSILLFTYLSVFYIPPLSIFNISKWFFGTVFITYLPGYVVYRLIFQKGVKKPILEQSTYSIVLSLALASFLGMILNHIPKGISVENIFLSYTFLILSLTLIRYLRKRMTEQTLVNGRQVIRNTVCQNKIQRYIFILFVSSIVLKLPFIITDLQGNKFGGDIATYSYWSNIVNEINNIPEWSNYMPLEQPSRYAPGIPILFSTISQLTGINSINLTIFFYFLSFELIALSIYLLLESYLNKRFSVLGLTFWIFSTGFSNSLVFSSPEKLWLVTGGTPPNVIGLLFIITLLFSVLKFDKTQESKYIFLMLILVGSMAIYHQLSFIILGGCFLLFLITHYKKINLKHLVIYLLIIIALLPLVTPSWLTDTMTLKTASGYGIESSILEKWAKVTSVKFENLPRLLGYSAVFFSIFGIIAETKFSKIKRSALFTYINKNTLYLGLCLLIIILLSHYAPYITGLHGMRFLYYTPIFILPLMMNGISNLINFFSKRNLITTSLMNGISNLINFFSKRNLITTSLMNGISNLIHFFSIKSHKILIITLLLITVSVSEGIIHTYGLTVQYSQKNYLFTSLDQESTTFLMKEAADHEVIVADHQKIKDSVWVKPFSMKQELIYPGFYIIEMTPPPYDGPMKKVQEIYTSPNLSNIASGFHEYNFTYFWFEKPYNQKEIEAFNLLSICTNIYENSEVIIFKIDVSKLNDEDIVRAENYYEISSDITIGSKPEAFGQYIGSKSTDEEFDGNFCVYSTSVSEEGYYDLVTSRYVYHTEEYIEVYVDDTYQGNISFTQIGWQLGNLAGIQLDVGQHIIKFVFMGTIKFSDGMDYFILKNQGLLSS
jgi:hypothetical protein